MLVWNLLTREKITQIEEIAVKMDLEIYFTEQSKLENQATLSGLESAMNFKHKAFKNNAEHI